MKRILLLTLVTVLAISPAFSQKYFTKTGKISFFSKTKMENIDATSNQATSVLDPSTGDLAFKVLLTSFQFDKALMQEHFNEKYVESEKFPESTFKGKITNLSAIDFKKDGSYTAQVSGDLTIHGVTKKVTTTGTIVVKGDKVTAQSKFTLALKDYKIEVPSAVKEKLSETIDINVNIDYAPLKK